jgi:hypothetical protein
MSAGDVALGVPSVDVRLAAGGQSAVVAVQPGKKRGRLPDLVAALLRLASGEGAAFGKSPEPAPDVPRGEALDKWVTGGLVLPM